MAGLLSGMCASKMLVWQYVKPRAIVMVQPVSNVSRVAQGQRGDADLTPRHISV